MSVPGRNKKYKRTKRTGKNKLWISTKERDNYNRLIVLKKIAENTA